MTKKQVDQWLEANTFQCALGRVSPKQCEALRKRPRLRDIIFSRRSWTLVMPEECEKCTEWKEKIKEVEEMKNQVKQRDT